ncbi:MAG: eukaryotic-like serine/threonine-protein kinase [Acidobacteriota bacterium]|jgi:serine/threonine protein kinase|nr:eukaryotic-like serine/threonine-protein kinase [Acidobacteriota bacterium]
MTPERYQRVKELFHSALERMPEERPAFLAEACGDDKALLAKVEALVAADEQPGSFMDAPAYAVATEMLTENSTGALVGQSIIHYQVLALLGSGGMGDVYLARDTRLGRKVALKLLPDYLTDDESRIRRFKQEARAASALNHPNVLTIYEIEQAGGRYFIATEFVEGETLRQRLKGGRLGPCDALDVAAQIAGALSKAHQAGIVHRDIKPENVMLDAEGRVKVLDFGLAKYTRPLGGGAADETYAESVHTEPGMLMGTTAYMSPEQARGLAVDARTDIWSLGVVLYEMLAGRVPFIGPTPSDVLGAILEREPEPLAEEGSGVPDALQRIVRKALRKDLERRYQTSKDFALDLESLRRKLEAEAGSGTVGSVETAARDFPATSALAGRDKSATVLVLGAVLLLAAAALVGMWAWRPSKPLTVGTALPPPVAAPERTLVYSILVQKYRDGRPFEAPFRLGGEINFEKDYRVRLNLSSPQDGYLYILNEGPAEPGRPSSYVILFPSPTANDGQSRLGAGRQVQVPERSWLQFDAEQGTEKVWLVWSAESVPALEALKAYANPRDRGLVGDPGLNDAARDFLLTHQNPRPAASRDEDKKEVVLTLNGAILAHLLRLEHH